MTTASTTATIHIASLNLANAMRDEATSYRFGLRFETILRGFKQLRDENKLDVLLVQELRRCADADGNPMAVADIVAQFALRLRMIPIVSANNGTSMSFFKAIFYDETRVTAHEVNTLWVSPNKACMPWQYFPTGSFAAANVQRVIFSINALAEHDPKTFEYRGTKNAADRFTICNVHAPLLPDGRRGYYSMLSEAIRDVGKHASNCLAIGDFNPLPDLQGEELLSQFFSSLKDWTPSGDTFVGFPHDVDAQGNVYHSALDKVFSARDANVKNVELRRTLVADAVFSDHSVVLVEYEARCND